MRDMQYGTGKALMIERQDYRRAEEAKRQEDNRPEAEQYVEEEERLP